MEYLAKLMFASKGLADEINAMFGLGWKLDHVIATGDGWYVCTFSKQTPEKFTKT